MRGLLIAAPASGSGKTFVSQGLTAALCRRNLKAQTFKVGPDAIDSGLQSALSGRFCYNLDGWIYTTDTCRAIFSQACANPEPADFALVEGVMGLFDGASTGTIPYIDSSSSAYLAKLLGLPVLLVVNAKAQGRTLAALLKGILAFDASLPLAGVILNGVSSANHCALLQEALAEHCPELTVRGFLPHKDALALPERHMGLLTAEEGALEGSFATDLADFIEEHIDLDGLLAALPDFFLPQEKSSDSGRDGSAFSLETTDKVRLGVAHDAAFCFLCPENLRLLQEAGAEIVFFSPLKDKKLPDNLAGLYLPGGYPDLHAEGMAENSAMRRAVKSFASAGGFVWAEGGGFAYLMRQLTNKRGQVYPMCGCFDLACRQTEKLQAMGYRELELLEESIFGQVGVTMRGHEFRYLLTEGTAEDDGSIAVAAPQALAGLECIIRNGRGLTLPGLHCYDHKSLTAGLTAPNIFGSYLQLHLGSCPGAASRMLKRMRGTKD